MADQFDYQNALRDRLSQISDFGTQQTTWAKLQASRQRAAQQAQDQSSQLSAQYQSAQQGAQNQNGIQSSDGFTKFKSAIQAQESGGNYGAVNRDSGAMGKYQVMPANINGPGGWDNEALGYNITADQYLKSPELQEKISSYKLNQYYQQYGPAGAAVAWYAGPGAAAKYAKTGKTGGAGGGYPAVSTYMQQILKRMGL